MISMSKGNKYICFGLIFSGITFLVRQLNLFYIVLPDFLRGFIEGFSISLGIILILFGLYCENPNLQKIKNYKIKAFNKQSGK